MTDCSIVMENLLTKRTVSERMFSRHCRILESLLNANSTSTRIIERHLNELNIHWNDLQAAHDNYVVCCLPDATDSDTEVYIDDLAAKFIAIEAACNNFMFECSSQSVNGNSGKQLNASIKLERIKFRTFDGDFRKYPKFKLEFNKFIAPLCCESQLTFVLKSYLCDSVRCEVENIDQDIKVMWERLDEKYGATHKLVDCILSDVKGLPACNDNASTLDMIRVIETAHSDLLCMDALAELKNATILSVIEQSMSSILFDDWVRLVAGKELSSEEKFNKLLPFLQHWKRMIEYENADIRITPTR